MNTSIIVYFYIFVKRDYL